VSPVNTTFRWRAHWLLLVLALVVCSSSRAQNALPLAISTESLPPPLVHQQYRVELKVTGGVPPYQWKISRGDLSQGLNLDPATGVISGVAVKAEQLEITLSVADSLGNTVSRDYKIKVTAPLLIEWSDYPRVQGNQIQGAVKVSNGTKDPFDLTVIILAVNEYGKAFALGYQRLDLKPDTLDYEIRFGVGTILPVGSYSVHADAVAEVAARESILRERQETATPLQIVVGP
jgi:hypothetical protein